jgi:hypothetical protein
MRPALCGPHSRPHASPRWWPRLRLSGVLARAWARAVSNPFALTFNTRPTFHTRPCLPHWPSRLLPFPHVYPERGGASRLPRPNNDGTSRPHHPPKLAPQTGFLPRWRRGRSLPSPCAHLPSLMDSDVVTGAANPFEIARDSRVGTEYGFFIGSAETVPVMVVRKKTWGFAPAPPAVSATRSTFRVLSTLCVAIWRSIPPRGDQN